MTPLQLDMVGVITSKFDEMLAFYRDTLDMKIKLQMESYVEFEHPGIRFAISTHDVMQKATGHASYAEERRGQSLELAFRIATPEEVDSAFNELMEKGATSVTSPADMPWGQRAAFFADPDGNIHEIFADLPK